MSTDTLIMRVSDALEEAQCLGREGPYGLYDYSPNIDAEEPYVVRDFRDPKSETYGHTIFKSAYEAEAQIVYEQLTKEHIAKAVIDVIGRHLVEEALHTILSEKETEQ